MKKLPPPHLKLFNHVGELRRKLHFPPSTLAERVGIDRSTLYKIEQNHIIPSILIALRIANTLDIKVDELFTLEETKFLTEEEKFDMYLKSLYQGSPASL